MQQVQRQDDARPRLSQLDYQVLGLVIERPSYGYEIANRLKRRYGSVDQVGQSAVYNSITRLDDAALIERMSSEQRAPEGRPRLYYRATAGGAVVFRDWVADLLIDSDEAGFWEVLARIASMQSPRAISDLLDRYELRCLQEAMTPMLGGTLDPLSEFIGDLAAHKRQLMLGPRMEWVAYARRRLQALGGT